MSSAFVYSLNYSIKVPGTNKVGKITGRAEFLDAQKQYCLEWIEQTGAALRWFTEPELTGAVAAGIEPDATAPPLTTIPPESAGANMTNVVEDSTPDESDQPAVEEEQNIEAQPS